MHTQFAFGQGKKRLYNSKNKNVFRERCLSTEGKDREKIRRQVDKTEILYVQSNGEASSEVSNRRQKLGVLQLQGFLSYYYPAFKEKVVVVFANEKDSKLVKICFEELNLKILMFIKMLNSTIVGIEPIGQNFEHKIQCL